MSKETIDPTALLVQITIALLAPLAASLIPITAGVRLTVREAISTYGLSSGAGLLDNWVARFRGVPYSVLLTLGNTFRNGRRVILSQIVLVGSGLIFMAVVEPIICVLTIVVSWVPARRAARLSVRESLAYQ